MSVKIIIKFRNIKYISRKRSSLNISNNICIKHDGETKLIKVESNEAQIRKASKAQIFKNL